MAPRIKIEQTLPRGRQTNFLEPQILVEESIAAFPAYLHHEDLFAETSNDVALFVDTHLPFDHSTCCGLLG